MVTKVSLSVTDNLFLNVKKMAQVLSVFFSFTSVPDPDLEIGGGWGTGGGGEGGHPDP